MADSRLQLSFASGCLATYARSSGMMHPGSAHASAQKPCKPKMLLAAYAKHNAFQAVLLGEHAWKESTVATCTPSDWARPCTGLLLPSASSTTASACAGLADAAVLAGRSILSINATCRRCRCAGYDTQVLHEEPHWQSYPGHVSASQCKQSSQRCVAY